MSVHPTSVYITSGKDACKCVSMYYTDTYCMYICGYIVTYMLLNLVGKYCTTSQVTNTNAHTHIRTYVHTYIHVSWCGGEFKAGWIKDPGRLTSTM